MTNFIKNVFLTFLIKPFWNYNKTIILVYFSLFNNTFFPEKRKKYKKKRKDEKEKKRKINTTINLKKRFNEKSYKNILQINSQIHIFTDGEN